jgi:hypothetical protein
VSPTCEVRRDNHQSATGLQDAGALLQQRKWVIDMLNQMTHVDGIEMIGWKSLFEEIPGTDVEPLLPRNLHNGSINIYPLDVPTQILHSEEFCPAAKTHFEESTTF